MLILGFMLGVGFGFMLGVVFVLWLSDWSLKHYPEYWIKWIKEHKKQNKTTIK